MAKKRVRIPRIISEKDKKEILSLKQEDIDLKLLKAYFADYDNKDSRFATNDIVVLNANEYYNKEFVQTTVGRIIYNKVILEPKIITHTGYCNYVMDADKISEMDNKVVELFMAEKLEISDVYFYFDQCNWFGYAPVDFVTSSMNADIYIIDPEVKKLKEDLIKKNQIEISRGNVAVITTIEKEILDLAKSKLKDDPNYEIYASGARGSFSNNYKNAVIFRGAVKNFENPNTFSFSADSLVDGISKQDFALFANIATAGTYARAKGTVSGGYLSKQVRSAFQHIMLDEKGSDCGTKKFLKIKIDKSTKDLFLYRYIKKGNDLLLLTPNNINSYMDKEVELRSPLYCKGQYICNHCIGELFYSSGIRNVGVLSDRVSSTLLQKALKLFHNSSVKTTTIDYAEHISELK